jgi:dihydroceramidase
MGALSLALWFLPDTRRWLFALVLGAALLAESTSRRARNMPIDTRWFWMGLLTFALGYAIWILDNARLLCDPASWLQGHALWHVLGAASTMFLANYYRVVE